MSIETISSSQLQANRKNAKKSTGPRSAAGKRRVSMNSFKHGRNAHPSLRPSLEAMGALGEDPRRYRELLTDVLESYPAENALQARICEEIAVLRWELERNHQAQEGKRVRNWQKVVEDRHTRMRQIQAGTSYDALQAEVLEHGLRGAPNCPTKFAELTACLERLAKRVGEGDFRTETELKAIYGKAPTYLGAGIINAFRALAKAPQGSGSQPSLVNSLEGMIQQELAKAGEEYWFYYREQIEITPAMRQECRAPAEDRAFLLLRRDEERLHRLLERKIKLLIAMEPERPGCRARARHMPWLAWLTAEGGENSRPAVAASEPSGAAVPPPQPPAEHIDSGAHTAALSHKIARVDTASEDDDYAQGKQLSEGLIRRIRQIYGLDTEPSDEPTQEAEDGGVRQDN